MNSLEYGICPRCGYVMFPVLPQLPCGHEAEPELADLAESGVVYSWTRAHQGDGSSRLFAMADFLDGSLRVTAPVAGASAVAIGDSVILVEGSDSPYALCPAVPGPDS